MKKHDYTGKSIFVGIDVHKRTYSVATIFEGTCVKRVTMDARKEELLAYLNKFFPGAQIYSAYEAGFSGFGLHRYLIDNGVKNIVVHAASIEVSSRDRVKTDKRDATKIAQQLSDGRLNCIHIPSREREDFRELTRLRDKLVMERTRTANAIKAKAHYYGLIDCHDSKVISKKWIIALMNRCDLAKNARFCLEYFVDEWHRISDKIKEVENLISQQAEEDRKLEEIYRSVPGIGPIAARVLSNELEDMSHFSSEKQLFSYTGLTPSEHSSGEHRRQGHISRQGKSSLRKILVQCAWVAIQHDEGLEKIYTKASKRIGGKRAIIGISRRLIGRARSCFKNNKKYCRATSSRLVGALPPNPQQKNSVAADLSFRDGLLKNEEISCMEMERLVNV